MSTDAANTASAARSRKRSGTRGAHRRHRAYWAFVGHRLSGIALAAFLPAHFLALGLALRSPQALDGFLAYGELPVVKVAEWGLVILLCVHLLFGARLLVLELLAWRTPADARLGWIVPSVLAAVVVGVVFFASVV